MASIITIPAIHLIGTKLRRWTRVFIECRQEIDQNWGMRGTSSFLCSFRCPSEQLVFVGSCGTVLGAWVGAFPILLDWNRAWQVSG